jgi:uncharacterized protein YndB with AHSA1/START domain
MSWPVTRRLLCMEPEQLSATITIDASPEAVFRVLADPTTHGAIDGTGWVREAADPAALSETGQTFRMAMYHEGHPNKDYEMVNRVEVLEPPRVIAWKPGFVADESGRLEFGGWMWRYDLEAVGPSETMVTLTYDWSGATTQARHIFQFPIFGVDHLEHSLDHLAAIATSKKESRPS